MKNLCIVLAVVFAVAQSKGLTAKDSVQVQLYYESLCPGCRYFITDQLFPTYEALGKSRIDLELIPAGKVTELIINGTRTFVCQHGDSECYGNKVHACALELASIDATLRFIDCAEKSSNPTDEAQFQQCAGSSGISWKEIQECLSSGKGDDLLSANANRTAQMHLKYVPTIVVDDVIPDDEEELYLNFKEIICNLIGNPAECDDA